MTRYSIVWQTRVWPKNMSLEFDFRTLSKDNSFEKRGEEEEEGCLWTLGCDEHRTHSFSCFLVCLFGRSPVRIKSEWRGTSSWPNVVGRTTQNCTWRDLRVLQWFSMQSIRKTSSTAEAEASYICFHRAGVRKTTWFCGISGSNQCVSVSMSSLCGCFQTESLPWLILGQFCSFVFLPGR